MDSSLRPWIDLRPLGSWSAEPLSTDAHLCAATAMRIASRALHRLPEFTDDLVALRELYVENTDLSCLPQSITLLTNLTKLWVFKNQLTSLPENIGLMTKLRILYVEKNNISRLPESLTDLTNLEELAASANKLSRLPDLIGNMKNLKFLYLGYDFKGNQISSIPESITLLSKLEIFNIKNNPVYSIPEGMTTLPCFENSLYLKTLRLNKPYLVISAEANNWAEISALAPRLICLPSRESMFSLPPLSQLKLSRILKDRIGTSFKEVSVTYERTKSQLQEATRILDRYTMQIQNMEMQLRQLKKLASEYENLRNSTQAQLKKLRQEYYGLFCLDLQKEASELAQRVDQDFLSIEDDVRRSEVGKWKLAQIKALSDVIGAPIEEERWKRLEMDGAKLLTQSEDSLKSVLGMSVLGDRLRMMRAIDLLKTNRGMELLPPTDPIDIIRRDERWCTDTIATWLQRCRLNSFIPDFFRTRMSVECLPYLTADLIAREMRISPGDAKVLYDECCALTAHIKKLPPIEFLCPISNSLMVDPVIGPDGRTYDRASLESYVSKQQEPQQQYVPPSTSDLLQKATTVRQNEALKQQIVSWIEESGLLVRTMTVIKTSTEPVMV
eukprot:TRINITY_DN12604_c0_g1_i2.p1 TRINITY_DN12604_c0_g1~~TRINITY_DN12604_c0_g1_i2.p1  ORF type:complete len:613 (-),score=129.42 TRINITY_DN12604_c0_g1_i2:439-2277(-)